MKQIKQFILERSTVNGFDFYKYLHIKGGSGNWKNKNEKFLDGGEYDFLLFYASPNEMKGCDMCERIWCLENNIPFGTGKTINEAYERYLETVKTLTH